MMKNLLLKHIAGMAVILLCTVIGLIACSDEEENSTQISLTIPEEIQTNGITFGKEGGTTTFYIQSSVSVQASSSQSWCQVQTDEPSATLKAVAVQLTVEENSDTQDRSAIITLTDGTVSAEVSVLQTEADGLVLETTSYHMDENGGLLQIKLTTNGEITYEISDVWINRIVESELTRSMEEQEFNFYVSANHASERSATIKFSLGTLEQSVIVTQSAGNPASIKGDEPFTVATSLGLGWNLGNQLDAYSNLVASETAWGNPVTTQALFDKLALAGITSVRIPVTWLGHVGAAPDYTIEESWLARVEEVVGYAEHAGLNAIINIHHDGADSEYWLNIKDAAQDESVNTSIKNQLYAMWTQIANRFKDKGNFLMFESMNEIHDGGWGYGGNLTSNRQYEVLNEWNQVFVDAVRATGGENSNRYLGVPGYVTNAALTVEHFVLPTDQVANRLLVSVHFYDPTDYTLEAVYSEWGHTGVDKASWGDEDNVLSTFSSLYNKFISQGVPVYIGEMGCCNRSEERADAFRKYYLEYVCKAAKEYGMAPFFWDNGSSSTGAESSGLFNHGTGEYLNNGSEIVSIMQKAIFTEDDAYTLQSVYDGAPQ